MPQMSPMNWMILVCLLLVSMMLMQTSNSPHTNFKKNESKMEKKQSPMKW